VSSEECVAENSGERWRISCQEESGVGITFSDNEPSTTPYSLLTTHYIIPASYSLEFHHSLKKRGQVDG
jgi:hypothetical protein